MCYTTVSLNLQHQRIINYKVKTWSLLAIYNLKKIIVNITTKIKVLTLQSREYAINHFEGY